MATVNDWEEAANTLLKENLTLHKLIAELSNQIEWLCEELNKHQTRLAEERRAFIAEAKADLEEPDMSQWINNILVKKHEDMR